MFQAVFFCAHICLIVDCDEFAAGSSQFSNHSCTCDFLIGLGRAFFESTCHFLTSGNNKRCPHSISTVCVCTETCQESELLWVLPNVTDGAVEDTTTNNEHLRVSMGCNSDSQDRGESRTKVLRPDDTTRTLMGQERPVFRAHWHHEAPSAEYLASDKFRAHHSFAVNLQ